MKITVFHLLVKCIVWCVYQLQILNIMIYCLIWYIDVMYNVHPYVMLLTLNWPLLVCSTNNRFQWLKVKWNKPFFKILIILTLVEMVPTDLTTSAHLKLLNKTSTLSFYQSSLPINYLHAGPVCSTWYKSMCILFSRGPEFSKPTVDFKIKKINK